MHVLELTFVVCCAVICLSSVAAGRSKSEEEEKKQDPEQSEPNIEDLQYTREETMDRPNKGRRQLTDKFEFQVLRSSSKKTPVRSSVSLLLFDSEERVWVEAYSSKNQTQKFITLRKPLIGYDLLKPVGCGGDEIKEQPFIRGRWGYVEEKENRRQCYMVTVSTNQQSVSRMYPDNCAQKEASMYKDENFEEADSRRSQRTFNSITQFTKAKIGNDRKFVCKVAYTHMGYATSLANGVPAADVKVYYKPNNGDDWGSYLLDLEWDHFSDGVNRFVSWVSKQQLNSQGVKWLKCFKCQVTINGVVARKCHGGCTCD